MNDTPVDPDESGSWASLSLDTCPRCGSAKVVPAVPGWESDRYCLACHEIVGPAARRSEPD